MYRISFCFDIFLLWNNVVILIYRGVGKWILKLMQGFFDNGSGSLEPEDLTGKGTKTAFVLHCCILLDINFLADNFFIQGTEPREKKVMSHKRILWHMHC